MESIQTSLFQEEEYLHPLNGMRVCLSGAFRIKSIELNEKLRACGVDQIDRVTHTRHYKPGDSINPARDTNLFVTGSSVNENSIRRYELNWHDGYKAARITEDELYGLIDGSVKVDFPREIKKHIELTFDYYNWKAPVINDMEFVTRRSSPLEYDFEKLQNPVYGLDVYIPDAEGTDTQALRQIVGNLGGTGNRTYYDETSIILLSDKTIEDWSKGVKSAVIQEIEDVYNKSIVPVFNVQFSSHSDFLKWVEARLAKYPDASTQVWVDKYKGSK